LEKGKTKANMQNFPHSDKAISPQSREGNGPESPLDTVILEEYANPDIYAPGELMDIVIDHNTHWIQLYWRSMLT
jgi:hypothetical protein